MRLLGISLAASVCLAASAFAGEGRGSGRFESLYGGADKVFVGTVRGVEARKGAKVFSLEALEPWKGATETEAVRLLIFEGISHAGDPAGLAGGGHFLFYLRRAPQKPLFTAYGAGLYLPAGGGASILPLEGEEGAEILAAARLFRGDEVPSSLLVAQLESPSERVRENALLSLAALPQAALLAEAGRIAEHLAREGSPTLCAEAVAALARSGEPGVLDPLLDFAIERSEGSEAIPLVAYAMNQIDAREAVRRIEARTLASGSAREARALGLLSRLDTPEALGEMLRRARKAGGDTEQIHVPARRIFSAARIQTDPSDLRGMLLSGSAEEKKAAAYSLFRWGSPGDRIFVETQSRIEGDARVRDFLQRLVRSPFLSFGDINL